MTRRKPPVPRRKRETITLLPNAVALTIAGSDPSGGAGLQADLKTFQQLGVYGESVVTLITVQNTRSVKRVESLPVDLVIEQLDAVLEDIPPRAIKTGALGNAEIVRAVGERLKRVSCPVIVDPVLVSKHGDTLANDDVVAAYREFLLPLAHLVTPNRFEAERLAGVGLKGSAGVDEVIDRIERFGPAHVLVKLGEETKGQSRHVLSLHDSNAELVTPRLPGENVHGSGCILAASITARLAIGATDMQSAVLFGLERTFDAIGANTHLGGGIHPAEIRAMRTSSRFEGESRSSRTPSST